jgi:hypothetical protein
MSRRGSIRSPEEGNALMRSLFKPVDGMGTAAGAPRLRGASRPQGVHRLTLATFVALCASACVLVGGVGSAWAGEGSFFFGPLGSGAGELNDVAGGPSGLAVDGESGALYVADAGNIRADKFGVSGEFLLGWGWNVIPSEGPLAASEFQVCTTATGCQTGLGEADAGVGQFRNPGPNALAVDNEPGPDHGDVYVVDGFNYRVQEFTSAGQFVRVFGGHVNKKGTNVCTAAEAAECKVGTEGEAEGEFSWSPYQKEIIAVGPGGKVYVGDKARVQVFAPSGVWLESVSLAGLSSTGKVKALAVNSLGDVFVKVEGVPGVHGFEPGGIEMAVKYDETSEAIESIAMSSADDLFISEKEGEKLESTSEKEQFVCAKCDFLEFGPSGEEVTRFGEGALVSTSSAFALDEKTNRVLVYGTDDEGYTSSFNRHLEYGRYGVWTFSVPAPGPLVRSGSEKAVGEVRGAATFEAFVNPEGSSTEAKVEYVDDAGFEASGYAKAASTASQTVAAGFEAQHVEVHLPPGTLIPGTAYHWRVVAHNAQGTNPGEDQVLDETPPVLVEGPWATGVTATSVTLSARVDPLSASTSYRLEYGTNASYGHVLAGSVGEGTAYVPIGYQVQGLEPGMVYHYRLVTESEVGVVEGADHAFTTQLAGGALSLPDGRAWELVSPAVKGGALIENTDLAQAASDGHAIVYTASEPLGEGIAGHIGNFKQGIGATVLSTRGGSGWSTRDISPSETLPAEGEEYINLLNSSEAFMTFSSDLSRGVLEPEGSFEKTSLSEAATEETLYVRHNSSETYEPLVTPSNVPAGVKWHTGNFGQLQLHMSFLAASPDLSHVLFADWAALTPGAITEEESDGELDSNLYEWSGGQLQLVNIVPNAKTGLEEPQPGAKFSASSGGGTISSDNGSEENPWGMSSDGRWIVFQDTAGVSGKHWFVRDMVEHKTVRFGRPEEGSLFETMSRDGSRLFYLEAQSGSAGRREGELFVLDPATGAVSDLTANHLDGEHSAGVQNMMIGISEDGTYAYFVAKGVLASGAVKGQNNLYVMHYDGHSWSTTFIGALSSVDARQWVRNYSEVGNVTARVAPDGRYLAFMSNASLTGYDNRDAVSGQPDEEVFLYDAQTASLVCASCDPSGARPAGVLDTGEQLMDQSQTWGPQEGRSPTAWLAAALAPNWSTNEHQATHRSSYLSDEGRLFFNSSDALVPQDTNGVADVYEYEPAGVGDCTGASVTFGERSDGCVSLISSGQAASESTYLEASEDGSDVFFVTAAKLVGEDYDTANDVYDARVCTVAVPCRAAPVSPPACTSGDSCKAAPSPQPEIFGPAPSATFKGTGNVTGQAPQARGRSKRLTAAQRLKSALRACRKQSKRKQRALCERRARKRYGTAARRASGALVNASKGGR